MFFNLYLYFSSPIPEVPSTSWYLFSFSVYILEYFTILKDSLDTLGVPNQAI